MKKYELVANDTIVIGGAVLTRIRALIDIEHKDGSHLSVLAGDQGGYVQSEANLSQEGLCWVGYNSKAYGKARVSDNAVLWNEAEVCQRAHVYGDAVVAGKVRGNAKVGDKAVIDINEVIEGITHLK